MRRTRLGALVSQYLEGISRTALAEYQQFFRDQARRRNGVYALYRKKKLYYVGLARDLRGRLKTHLRDKHARRLGSTARASQVNMSRSAGTCAIGG